jgi:hypothetical protein
MRRIRVRKLKLVSLAVPAVLVAGFSITPASAAGSGVGIVPQGLQSDSAYIQSAITHQVTNVFATSQKTSCYRPEVPFLPALTGNGYTGMTTCSGATTGENTGAAAPYPSQVGSNPGFPAATSMQVKDHSESDIRVDPTNPMHLIGSSKWAVSAEGYNHLLGYYESFDGGLTWPNQGHIPGYEGWTDNTDPVGAFDTFGNYYSLILPYEFFYTSSGGHSFKTNPNIEPNPSVPAEAITVAILHKHGANDAPVWSTSGGAMDVVAPYPAKGREPDKQWITIDINPASPHLNRIYAMWTVFDSFSAVPWVSFADARSDGTHTPWSAPQKLPTAGSNPQGDTYLLPHADGNGTVYTTLTNFEPNGGFCCTNILLDKSMDGGVTWQSVSNVITEVSAPPLIYPNTTFRDGIEDTFAVGTHRLANGQYPLYVSWEDHSVGFGNLILSASYDGGLTWSSPIQVNDNTSHSIDAFQPNLTTAADGTVVLAFYDRRLTCPALGTADAVGAGLSIDNNKPFGAANYCVNASVQFYKPNLTPKGNNIRISLNTWDPELNSLKPAGIGATEGFIGDYYGNITSGRTDYTTSVSTFNDGHNSGHFQQQVVATVGIP